jgi:hypothetical protein
MHLQLLPEDNKPLQVLLRGRRDRVRDLRDRGTARGAFCARRLWQGRIDRLADLGGARRGGEEVQRVEALSPQ